jgi:predicted nucleic acid-binding protein
MSTPASEAATRKNLIDPLLIAAHWRLTDHAQVEIEIPVKGYDPTPWQGTTDYCLYDESGNVLAIVEAKRTSRDAREKAEAELADLETRIAPLQREADRLSHPFWVTKLSNSEGEEYLKLRREPGIDDADACAIAIAYKRNLPLVTDDGCAKRLALRLGVSIINWRDFVAGR